MNSKEKLAAALGQYMNELAGGFDIPAKELMIRVHEMIEAAKKGYYSDYDSPLTTPCIQLVTDLTTIGTHSLVELAKNGEFDATPEESYAWYKREGRDLAVKSFGEEAADALFGKVADALFGKLDKEEKEAKEGIKGWDI